LAFSDRVEEMDRSVLELLGGVTVRFQVPESPPYEVTGIFDEQFMLAKGGAPASVEALGPAVFVRLADLPDDPEDVEPTLTIGDVDYSVTGRIPDGMGGVVLVLRRVT